MKKLFTFLIVSMILLSGCVYHGQGAKKTAGRLSDRSRDMLEKDQNGARDEIPPKFFKDNVDDAALNEKELGSPKERTDIEDPKAVAADQAKHAKEQAIKETVGIGLGEGLGVLAGLLGFGGLFVKVKSSFDKVKKVAESAKTLYGSSIKGVEKYKDQFEEVVDALPIDQATKDKIHEQIGRTKINELFAKEAMKTGLVADHIEAVNRIKAAI